MSEAITKACNAYRCDGGICKYTEMPWVTCFKCKGTGRVPDVKATLRAEVARLTTHVEGLIEVNRINLDVAKSQEAAHLSLMQTTTAYYEAEVARLTAENARLAAEVERLTGCKS